MDEGLFSKTGFKTLYIQYADRMYGVAYDLLHNQDTATEIVQQLFVSLWERRETLELKGPVEHYLMRATKLKVLEHIRNAAIERRCLQDASFAKARYANVTESQVNFRQLSQRVDELVRELPNQCRTVYQLSREEGLNNREISGDLHISEKTVEAHLTKALKVLRGGLKDFFSND